MKTLSLRTGVVLALVLLSWPAAAAEREPSAGVDPDHLARRSRELAARGRPEVLAEVARRAAELGVAAPAGQLADLLLERAQLDLALAACPLATDARCAGIRTSLADLDRRFQELAGLAPEEFKRGRREGRQTPAPDGLTALRTSLTASSSRTAPDHCVCDVSIYSSNRFLNRYWGLECNNHGGHGVCSNNVDSAHSPGSGAMTGDIQAYFGEDARGRSCPDDHQTCFKGPMSGQWGNVCNCDTWHSQFTNPTGSWYGGDLTDSVEVFQASFPQMLADGSCPGKGLTVKEYIEENDPWCCDDPMGDLFAHFQVAEGSSSQTFQASAQNCNGGSQSGVPPYCGTFGATIRLAASCTTRLDDQFGSCSGRCGQVLPDATCNCDFDCQSYGDCCFDYCSSCASQSDPPMPCNEF